MARIRRHKDAARQLIGDMVSGRRLVEHCSVRLAIHYFLGYEVDEDLPWHFTISRTQQLYPAAVFKWLFNYVFVQYQYVAAGLVKGHTQAVDSASVKASAALESLCEKQPADAPNFEDVQALGNLVDAELLLAAERFGGDSCALCLLGEAR